MGSATPFIGIDFGTSKSSMAWFNPKTGQAEIIKNAEGEDKTPSVAYFGEHKILVGKPAEYMLEDEVERKRVVISAKRELVPDVPIVLPDRRVKAVEVAAEILRKLRIDAEEGHFHQEVHRAVITCPAAFDLPQRDKIVEAGRLAGFTEIKLLEEPTAAALAYAQAGLRVGNHVLVYDLGAGTFDLAVVARGDDGSFRLALEPKGIARCGGDDFDRVLYDHCDELARQTLGRPISLTGELDLYFLRECRDRKESLSAQESCMFSSLLPSEQGVTRFRHAIERATFEALIDSHIEATVRLTKAILDEAAAWGYTVDTVVLIGGSSRVPLALRLLTETLPVAPRKSQIQDVAVALGAAHYGHNLWDTVTPEPPAPAPFVSPSERYYKAVESVWTHKQLDRAAAAHLAAFARELQISAEAAAAIERSILGDAKEAILRIQTKPDSLPDETQNATAVPVGRGIPRPDTLPGGSRPKPGRPTDLPS